MSVIYKISITNIDNFVLTEKKHSHTFDKLVHWFWY